ncbi:MAG: WD40 repeat domain-containing protein [Chloroflexota bacterium]
MASTIDELYGGNVDEFLAEKVLIFDDIRDVLDQQFGRLSFAEQSILFWLAVEREPVELKTLRTNFPQWKQRTFTEALRSLQRRSLVETTHNEWMLQNVVMEYLSDRLIDAMSQEFFNSDWALYKPTEDEGSVNDGSKEKEAKVKEPKEKETGLLRTYLNRYPLLKAQSKAYVRQIQARLLLGPVAENLIRYWGKANSVAQLKVLVNRMRATYPRLPGYTAANLFHLLIHLNVDLRGYDFSKLALWQIDLRRTVLPQVNFSESELHRALFPELLSTIYVIAFDPTGQILLAGLGSGIVKAWRVADQQLIYEVRAHQDGVRRMQISEDGKRLVTASVQGEVRLWAVSSHMDGPAGDDLARDGLVRDEELLQPMQDMVSSGAYICALRPDGNMLAATGAEFEITLWNTQTDQVQGKLPGHAGGTYALCYSPNGAVLASGGADHVVRLWQMDSVLQGEFTSMETRASESLTQTTSHITLKGHTNYILSIAFSPDSERLASSGDDWTIRIWESASGRHLQTLTGHTTGVHSVAFSSDGATLVSGDSGGIVRLWDVHSGQLLHTLHHHQQLVWSVAFHPDGQLVASGSADHTIHLWNRRDGQLRQTLQGHPKAVLALASSPDGQWLASGGADMKVYLWPLADLSLGKPDLALGGHTDWVLTVAFHPRSQLLASAGNDGKILLWTMQDSEPSRKPTRILHGHDAPITQVVFHPSGKILATSSYDKSVRLWEVESGKLLHILKGHSRLVWSVAFSNDGNRLYSSSGDETVCLWDLTKLDSLEVNTPHQQSAALGEEVVKILCTSDDKFLVANAATMIHRLDHSCQLLDTQTHKATWMWDMAQSRDGSILATTTPHRMIKIWQMPEGKEVGSLIGHQDDVAVVAISPDDRTIYSASTDGEIKLWDTDSGKCVKTLRLEAPFAKMNISGLSGITEAQRESLKVLGAIELCYSGTSRFIDSLHEEKSKCFK